MNTRSCRFLLLLWLGVSIFTQAQVPSLTFEHLTVADGLPSSMVYSISKDRQGFMWFGTRRCPVRYDGIRFRPYLTPETSGVMGLEADTANTVWGTADRGGVFRITANGLRIEPVTRFRKQVGSCWLASAREGWFSSYTGIEKVDLRTCSVQTYPMRKTSYYGLKVKAFLRDHQQRIWAVGSDNGLFRFDRQQNRFVCVLGPDSPNPARRLPLYLSSGCVGPDHQLWIGTFGNGLLHYNPDTDAYQWLKVPNLQNNVTCVRDGHDETGRPVIWVGDVDGLLAFRPEQQRFYRIPTVRATPPNREPIWVNTVFQEPGPAGILWVGTSNGVFKYNPQDHLVRSVQLPALPAHQPPTVNVLLADQADTSGQTFFLGLSNQGFLQWHRPTNRFTFVPYPSARAETMWMQQAPDHRLWIGLRRWDYRGDGVLVYDLLRKRFVQDRAASQAGKLFSVPFVDHGLIDQHQRLWIGNNDEGVRVLDLKTGQPLHFWPDSVVRALQRNNNFLTGLALDKNGRIWLATYRGLYYWEAARHQFIRADDQNPVSQQPEEPAANTLLVSQNNHIWAARWGSVTESLPSGKLLTTLTTANGLYDRENRRLAEDAQGQIWIGNPEGLHGYNPRTHRMLRLTTSDGLTRNNTTAALLCHRGNELLIGQVDGIDYIDLRQLHRQQSPIRVVVSALRIHQQERPFMPGQPVRLARTDNEVSVDFTTLAFSRLANAQYAYRLEGLDKSWTYSGAVHQANYTNLSPGQYTLFVKAADTVGRWSAPVRLRFEVLPAYYETWWFRTALVLLAMGILYGLYQYRVRQLMRVHQMRTQISADLHDEIGSSLSGISIMGTMARQQLAQQHPAGSLLDRITAEAYSLSSALDDIVWSINPRNDELSALLTRMHRQAAELFETANIRYQITLPDMPQPITLSMERRHDFYLMVKEAVTNLVKHAHCQHAELTIQLTNRSLMVTLTDDGIGFDPTAPTDRNGLQNLHKRAQQLHGKLTVTSQLGAGTTVRFSFPV